MSSRLICHFALISILALLLPLGAHALRLDVREIERSKGSFLYACGFEIRPTTSAFGLFTDAGVGLGFRSGSGNDLQIDGTETIEVSFPNPSLGVRYSIEAAGDQNDNGTFGQHFVEAFQDASSLGVVELSGVGIKDLETAFGGQAISRFLLSAAGDGIRITWFEYSPEPGARIEITAITIGLVNGPSVELCDVLLTGSANVFINDEPTLSAIGVLGGASSNSIDTTESLLVEFPAAATSIEFISSAGNANGNGTSGDGFIQGFDAAGESLGIQSISGLGTAGPLDVNALFGDVPLSAFQVTANGDPRRVSEINFVPEPNHAGPIALAAVLGLRVARRRSLQAQQRRSCRVS